MTDQFWHGDSLLNPTVFPPLSVWTQCRMGSSSFRQRAGKPTDSCMSINTFLSFLSPFVPLSPSHSHFPGLRCLIFGEERWKLSRHPKASTDDVTSHHSRWLSHHSLRYNEALHNHVPQKCTNARRELFLTAIDKDAWGTRLYHLVRISSCETNTPQSEHNHGHRPAIAVEDETNSYFNIICY